MTVHDILQCRVGCYIRHLGQRRRQRCQRPVAQTVTRLHASCYDAFGPVRFIRDANVNPAYILVVRQYVTCTCNWLYTVCHTEKPRMSDLKVGGEKWCFSALSAARIASFCRRNGSLPNWAKVVRRSDRSPDLHEMAVHDL